MRRSWWFGTTLSAWIVTAFAASQPILVLQSDFGTLDGAVASMKGVAVGVSPDIDIYDLTHQIEPFNIWQGALRLVQTAEYWPADTVFVSVVDPGVGTVLFGVKERNTLETASPDDKLIFAAQWTSERWSILARATRWGEATRVFNFGGGFEPEQTYGSEVDFDLDVEFDVTKQFAVAIGANNVLDEYPDLSSADINFFGNLPYDVLQPITFNGAFYYLRTTYSF